MPESRTLTAAAARGLPGGAAGRTVVFYDGVCGLCDRLVQLLLRLDRGGRLLYAPLQGELAAAVLPRYGVAPDVLDTVLVLTGAGTPEERLYRRSTAILKTMDILGGAWSGLWLLRFIPAVVRDWAYDRVAERRYAIFGQFDACQLPSPQTARRFLD